MKMWWASVVALAGALLVGCHEGPGDSGADAASGGPETIGVGGTIGTVPGSCTAASQCPDFYDGCKTTSCVEGKCVSEAKDTGAFCTAPTLIPAECETTRCDSAGLCVIAPVADGSACGPEDACTLGTCAAGSCGGKVVPADCDDGNACTIDGCGPGGCTNAPSTAACDDGDSCTSGDSCAAGACVGTPSCECDADADCEATDENLCDGTSKCTGGTCVNDPKTAVVCPKPVTAGECEAPVCDPGTGKCSLEIVAGQECSDGIACTTGDACTAEGLCESTKVVCEYECTGDENEDGDDKTDCEDSDCVNDSACAVAPECTTPADCPPIANVCVTRTCDEGQCGELNVVDETPVPDQTPGNCQLEVCNGDGETASVDDATDLPTSKTACLIEPACTGTPLAPSFTAVAAGTNCAADGVMGKALCGDGEAEGTCVACNTAADCPATENECVAATCDEHVCGTENLGETVTATDGQESGDCQKLVCNGAGGTKSVDDANDLPTSPSACLTSPACTGEPLAPSFTPAAAGTDCSADGVSGGAFCGEGVMAGVCGECNSPSDCPETGNVCIVATCIENECGTENLGETTALEDGQTQGDCQLLVCDGSGDSKSVDDATDLPASTTACLVSPACEGEPLAPSLTPAPQGTNCSADGLSGKSLCGSGESAGACVSCNVAADCTAPAELCKVATCLENVCGIGNAIDGASVSTGQTTGNCQKVVCNGSGGTKSVDDPTDLPTSTTACLVSPACTGTPLAKTFTPAATGTSCSADGVAGKKVCGNTSSAFSGTCVECTADTHCTAGTCNTALAICIPNPTCSDNAKNGLEVGIDCGGPCPGCPADTVCTADVDCASAMCFGGKCVATLNGCTIGTATDVTGSSSTTVTFANGNLTYAPKCLKVKQGTAVTFSGNFGSHPMIGGVVTTSATAATTGPFVPVTNTGSSKVVTMSTTGIFPYYCQPHATLGMNGVVFVVP